LEKKNQEQQEIYDDWVDDRMHEDTDDEFTKEYVSKNKMELLRVYLEEKSKTIGEVLYRDKFIRYLLIAADAAKSRRKPEKEKPQKRPRGKTEKLDLSLNLEI
jgi:hypothetical protein